MKEAAIASNEEKRLKNLYKYQILDSEEEISFEEIIKIARKEFGICWIFSFPLRQYSQLIGGVSRAHVALKIRLIVLAKCELRDEKYDRCSYCFFHRFYICYAVYSALNFFVSITS